METKALQARICPICHHDHQVHDGGRHWCELCGSTVGLTKEQIHMELMRNNGRGVRVGRATLTIESRNRVVVHDWSDEERIFGNLTAAVDDFYYLT